MEKQDIINYVLTTPENTNPAILEGMLEQLVAQSGGGGGDESDLTTAEVKFINSAENKTYSIVKVPVLDTSVYNSIMAVNSVIETEKTITVVLYKGNFVIPGSCVEGVAAAPVLTGDITLTDAGFVVTGNGTITFAGNVTPT